MEELIKGIVYSLFAGFILGSIVYLIKKDFFLGSDETEGDEL